MTTDTQSRLARLATSIAGVIILVCLVILLRDALVARALAPQDDRRIKTLQEQVKTDALLAPALAAEEKAITQRRLARKARDNRTANILIAAAVLFLIGAKWLLKHGAQPAFTVSNSGVSESPSLTAASEEQPPRRVSQWAAARGGTASLRQAPEIDLSFVDEIVAREGRGKESAIILLQAIQTHYRYLPDEALRRLCELTEITPAQIAGTSSFYGQFRRSPVGRHVIRVCHGTACHVAGARQITEELRRYLAIPEGADTDPARTFTVDEVACLGCCSLAPVLMVDGQTAGKLTPATVPSALQAFEQEERA